MKKIIKTKGTPYEQNGKDLAIIDTFFKTKKPIMVGSKELKLAWENREQELEEPLSVKTEMDGYGEDMFNSDGSLNPDKFIIKKGIGDLSNFYAYYSGLLKGSHIEDVSEITKLDNAFYEYINHNADIVIENMSFDSLESISSFMTRAALNSLTFKNCKFPKLKKIYCLFYAGYVSSSFKGNQVYVENLDFPEVEELDSPFNDYAPINNNIIDMAEFNMPKLKKTRNLFYAVDANVLSMGSFNNYPLEDVTGIFYNYNGSVNLDTWDTSKIKIFAQAFQGAKNISTSALESLSYESAEDMNYCFYNNTNSNTLDLSKLNLPKVKDISYMLGYGTTRTSLDYSQLNLPETLEKADGAFAYMSALTSFNLGQLATLKLKSLKEWFIGCKALTTINIRNVDMSETTTLQGIFKNCENLEMVYLPDSLCYPNKIESLKEMFYGCKKFPVADLSPYDLANVKDISYMFSGCTAITSANLNSNLTTKLEKLSYLFQGTSISTIDLTPIFNIDITREWDLSAIFHGCTSLTNVVFPTEPYKLKTLYYMFYNCSSLENIDLSNAESIGSLYNAFYGCTSLKNIIWSSKELTLKDNNLYYAFQNCKALTSIDLSGFRFSENPEALHTAPRLTYAFYGCSSLTSVKFPKGIWSSTSAQDLDYIIRDCSNLEELDLSFVYAPMYRMSYIMTNCTKLKKFIMPNVTRASTASDSMPMTSATTGCTSLELIDIRNLKLTTSEANTFFSADIPKSCKIITLTQEVKDYLINTKGFTNVFTKEEVE